jgi:hypothetical protein
VLTAEVLSQPQTLTWQGKDVECWVIEYRGDDDSTARTWVSKKDNKVLRQEAFGMGEQLRLQRED